MIRYALKCTNHHTFEAWFRNSDTFEIQCRAGEVACPHCASTAVEKAIMAPRVVKSSQTPAPMAEPTDRSVSSSAPDTKTVTATDAPEVGGTASGAAGGEARQMIAMLRALRRAIEATGDPVGQNFAEEARKIHYGETAPRAIYGDTTPEEAEALADEGIEINRIPWIPLAN